MGLHVNSNLALEIPVALATPAAVEHDPRAELAAQFIATGARVLDLSATKTLERFLPHGASYRREGRRGADLARDDFPTEAAADSDIIVMLGVIERVTDVESLFTHLRFARRDVLLSYAPADLAGERASLANHLGYYDLTLLFDRYGFRIACTAPLDNRQVIMRLTPTERLLSPPAARVALVMPGTADDFATRLGLETVQSLLPGETEVHRIDPVAASDAQFDLAIVGTGTGLFQPLVSDALIDVLSRAKASIGIFGTQYRELMPRAGLDRLLDRLDVWYARYEDDILMYGRGRDNVVHLGDWLIDRFALATSTADAPLEIDGPLEADLALDRAIATIQRHRQVYSTQAGPFLCALTSAELAAYADAPAPMPSSQFRSLLIDVFGRSYPEKKFFMVDRDAVARYKTRVHRNVGLLRARIETILRDVTA